MISYGRRFHQRHLVAFGRLRDIFSVLLLNEDANLRSKARVLIGCLRKHALDLAHLLFELVVFLIDFLFGLFNCFNSIFVQNMRML